MTKLDKLRAKLDRQIDKGSAKAHVTLTRILKLQEVRHESDNVFGGINRCPSVNWRPLGGDDLIRGLENILHDDMQRSLKAQADKAHKTLVAIKSKKGEA